MLPSQLAQLSANRVERFTLGWGEPLARDVVEDRLRGIGLTTRDRVPALRKPGLDGQVFLIALHEMIGCAGVLAALQPNDRGFTMQIFAQLG